MAPAPMTWVALADVVRHEERESSVAAHSWTASRTLQARCPSAEGDMWCTLWAQGRRQWRTHLSLTPQRSH